MILTHLLDKIFTSTIGTNQTLHVASSPQIIEFLELRYDDFWIYSISNKLPNLMFIASGVYFYQLIKEKFSQTKKNGNPKMKTKNFLIFLIFFGIEVFVTYAQEKPKTENAVPQLRIEHNAILPTNAINWKPFFTLNPEEGTEFDVDSISVVPNANVPGLNIANDGRVILGWAPNPPGHRVAGTSNDTGKTFIPLSGIQQPLQPDGAFIYLQDGRTRFVCEEPLPGSTPQRHKSRIISYISSDGLNWVKENGIRYQPGIADDSIASVPSVIQVKDSIWRMYYVGDWYRTNGIRTAISNDWGWTWQAESGSNILRNGDVDPHAVYLTNGKIRLYHRSNIYPGGIAYTDGDGLLFDTTTTTLLIEDSQANTELKLDPAVIKFPNGEIACYIGIMSFPPQFSTPKIIAAWAVNSTSVPNSSIDVKDVFELAQNYPNPFNPTTTIRFSLPRRLQVTLKVYDILGREIATLVNEEKQPGQYSIVFDASNLPSGLYVYQLITGSFIKSKQMMVLR